MEYICVPGAPVCALGVGLIANDATSRFSERYQIVASSGLSLRAILGRPDPAPVSRPSPSTPVTQM
jgi:hypothetical protein